jgi:malate dehydrogenase (oxaloacetate-decarboxylating)
VRPGSLGSLESESRAAMHEAARRAVQRAVARRFDNPD